MNFPLMPQDPSMIAGPTGGGPGSMGAPPSTSAPPISGQPGGGNSLASMLGLGNPSASTPSDALSMQGAISQALQQLDFIANQVSELARAYPGNDDAARMIMEGVMQWKQGIVTTISTPGPLMPGAAGMM